MSDSNYWRLETASEIVWADFVDDPVIQTLTPGRSLTYSFVFKDTDSSSGYGSDAYGDDPYGGRSMIERYEALLVYSDVAGDEVLRRGLTDQGRPWFRERIPLEAPVESLLISIEPFADVDGVRGVWGLLVDVVDSSIGTAPFRQLECEVFVLAPLSEYDDHDAVRTAFESEVV